MPVRKYDDDSRREAGFDAIKREKSGVKPRFDLDTIKTAQKAALGLWDDGKPCSGRGKSLAKRADRFSKTQGASRKNEKI